MPLELELPLARASGAGFVAIPFPHEAWLTLVSAGDMRDPDNRRRILERIGLAPRRVAMVRQVHSRRVVDAEDLLAADSFAASIPTIEADAIVSAADGPHVCVGIGDCMPILICDAKSGAFAIAHSGWRGTGILETTIDRMAERFGSVASDLIVTFGPCISAASYVVDEERAAIYREWGDAAVAVRDGRSYLDMRAANLGIARRAGIDRVTIVNHCTYTARELGSFRREGPGGYTGMLAILGPRIAVRRDEDEDE